MRQICVFPAKQAVVKLNHALETQRGLWKLTCGFMHLPPRDTKPANHSPLEFARLVEHLTAHMVHASPIYIHEARVKQVQPLILTFDQDSLIIPLHDDFRMKQTDDAWTVEQYAGGFGGWTHASRFLNAYTFTRRRTIAIESHMPYATQFALSHGFDLIGQYDNLPSKFVQTNDRDVIFHTTVQSRTWQKQLQALFPELWLISAPCKSWSSAGRQQGFHSPDGLCLAESIAQTRIFRPKIVALEQVKGFRDHQHYPIACRMFEWAGYSPLVQCALDLEDLTPSKRKRWLALYIRTQDADAYAAFTPQPWPQIPSTVATFEASMELTATDLASFQPTKEQAAKYFDAKYMPGPKRNWSKMEILQQRLPKTDGKLPTFMAAYGEQHLLDDGLLLTNGLFGFFRRQATTFRFWTPVEAALMHGVTHPVLILKPAPYGWQTIGNAIAPLHALFLMFHAYELLSNFHETVTFETIVKDFMANRLRITNACILQDECAWYLGLPGDVEKLQQRLQFFMAQLCWKTNAQNAWPENHLFSPITGLTSLLRTKADCIEVSSASTQAQVSQTLPIHLVFEVLPYLIPGEYGIMKVDGQTSWRTLLSFWNFGVIPTGLQFDWDMVDECIVDTMPACKTLLEPIEHRLTGIQKIPDCEVQIPTVPILIRESTNLALYEVEKGSTFKQLKQKRQLPDVPFYDQHGPMNDNSWFSTTTAISCDPHEILPIPGFDNILPLLTKITVENIIPPRTDILVMHCTGPAEAYDAFQLLWTTPDMQKWLEKEGRQANLQRTSDIHWRLLFRPKGPHPAMPVTHLRELIFFKLMQKILVSLQSQTGQEVLFKYQGKPVIRGFYPPDMSVAPIWASLRHIFMILEPNRQPSLVSSGKIAADASIIRDLAERKLHPGTVIIQIMLPILGGGMSSKQEFHKMVEAGAAALFLEHGLQIAQVPGAITKLIDHVGLQRLHHIVHGEGGKLKHQSFEAACKAAEIALPNTNKLSMIKAKYQKTTVKKQNSKAMQFDPDQYHLKDGFFRNSDDTQATILQQFSPQSSGVILLGIQQASDWITATTTLSPDELAIYVVGPIQIPAKLSSAAILAPAIGPDGQEVLLNGQLIQLGSKPIKTVAADSTSIEVKDVQVASVTVWKSDWDEQMWKGLCTAPVRTLKNLLTLDGHRDVFGKPWGRMYQDQGVAVEPEFATSFQVHGEFENTPRFKALLKRSGFNKIFITPKDTTGKPHPAWKVVWLDLNPVKLEVQAAALTGSAGLVKGKKSYGIRVEASTFEAAWTTLKPGLPQPDLRVTALLFRLQPLPQGITSANLLEWGRVSGWDIKPIKAVGAKQWIVGSDNAPPSILQFNGQPLLVKQIHQKGTQGTSAIAAGPRTMPASNLPKPIEKPNVFRTGDPHMDPWKPRGTTAGPEPAESSKSAETRQVTGPVTTMFQQQEARILAVETALGKIQESQNTFSTQAESRFLQIESNIQQHAHNTQQGFEALRTEQTNMHQSLATAMTQQDERIASSFDELKRLFLSTARKRSADDGQEMREWLSQPKQALISQVILALCCFASNISFDEPALCQPLSRHPSCRTLQRTMLIHPLEDLNCTKWETQRPFRNQHQNGSNDEVEWEMACFPHVRDLWCGSRFKLPGSLAPLPTFSPTSIPRGQCSPDVRGLSQLQPLPRPSNSRWQFCLRLFRLTFYAAIRVGEADNPGPSHTSVKFGVTNPTTIYKKGHLATDLDVDVLLLSETAATVSVQTLESKSFRERGYQTVWGHPMLPHRQTDRDAGHDTFKGIAAGVSTHSRFPIRPTRLRDTSEWFEAGRIQQVFLQFPHHEFQLINIYGFPANDRKAKLKTNQLIDHAISIAMTNTFPIILCGDFNHHPDDLDALKPLWDKGFRTAAQIYQQVTGHPIPPTFQEATSNDVAIFAPSLVPMVQKVWVDNQKLVAGHNPLCFEMHLPNETMFQQIWRLPKTWLSLDPKKEMISKNFQPPNYHNSNNPLLDWSMSVEDAVHHALRDESDSLDQAGPSGLPRSHRGRCLPPRITQQPCPRGIKPAWHDHYTPAIDQATMKIKQLTKQMRRIQSLKRRVQRWESDHSLSDHYYTQLWEEWMCILKAKGFSKGFLAWIREHPDIMQIPLQLPTAEYLHDLEQILRHHTDQEVYKQNQKHAKLAQFVRTQDVKKYGRSSAFQSVKEQGAGLLSTVETPHQIQVIAVEPPAYGLIQVQLPEQTQIDSFDNLRLNHHPVQVVQWNPPCLELMLEDPDIPYDAPLILEYNTISAQPPVVAAALDSYWRTFWNRDDNPPDDHWDQLNDILDRLPPLPTMDIDLFDLQVWKQAIKALKSKSARGCCAWAPDELKMLPDCCIQSLIAAFQASINDGMGLDLMAARTVPILKKPGAQSAAQTRPITVLSLLYRLWGRVVSQQILKYWGQFFPTAVTGFLPHRSTFLPMYDLQHQLESAHGTCNQHLSGLTLDLTKCFNTLPLTPAKKLLGILGVPPEILQFWFSSIQALTRVWQVGKQTFYTGPQSTGVPEGDAMSVLVMLGFNYVWTTAIADLPATANAYADNWAYAVPDVQTHLQVLPVLLELIQAMKLTVDWGKTWIWITDKIQEPVLKRLLSQLVPDQVQLQCVANAKDLGFVLHYRRKQYRQPQKERHARALTTLRKLQKSPHDMDTKALIAQTAINRALYGAHCHVTGETMLRELRSEVANALVGLHRNINPYLASTLLSKTVTDPEMCLIHQSIRHAREYLNQCAPEKSQSFLEFAARRKHDPRTVTGPAGALSIYLSKVGWQITDTGHIHVSAFYTLHIQWTDWPTLTKALEHSWMEHVALMLSSRKGYRGMPTPDRPATLRMVQDIPDKAKNIAAYAITGGYMLQHQKSKFDVDATDICPYCKQDLDGHIHRVLECPFTASARVQYQPTCDYFTDLDALHVTCPIMYRDPSWELHRQLWHAIDPAPLVLPPFAMQTAVYTDGSCQLPQDPTWRYAANAAVCIRPGVELQNLKDLPPEQYLEQGYHVISVSLLQGPQSIARAELDIVVRLIEAKHPGPLITDSQYVINMAHMIAQQPQWQAFHTKANFDLLYRWHQMHWTHQHRPPVHKVTSHRKTAAATSAPELAHILGNGAADEAAKQACKKLAQDQHRDLHQQHADMAHHHAMLVQQFKMRYDIGILCMHFDRPEVCIHHAGDNNSFLQQMKDFKASNGIMYNALHVPEAAIHASRWGTNFTDILLQWLSSLKWGPPDYGKPPVGISWIELIFNFLLTTQLEIPVNTAPYKQESKYLTSDEGAFDISSYDFSHTIMSFQRAVEHLQFLGNCELVPPGQRTKTGSLYYMGAGSLRNGFRQRPEMPKQTETLQFLRTYMNDHMVDGKVQFEKTPLPPDAVPIFVRRFDDPEGITPRDRAVRYHSFRLQLQQQRNGGAWANMPLLSLFHIIVDPSGYLFLNFFLFSCHYFICCMPIINWPLVQYLASPQFHKWQTVSPSRGRGGADWPPSCVCVIYFGPGILHRTILESFSFRLQCSDLPGIVLGILSATWCGIFNFFYGIHLACLACVLPSIVTSYLAKKPAVEVHHAIRDLQLRQVPQIRDSQWRPRKGEEKGGKKKKKRRRKRRTTSDMKCNNPQLTSKVWPRSHVISQQLPWTCQLPKRWNECHVAAARWSNAKTLPMTTTQRHIRNDGSRQ